MKTKLTVTIEAGLVARAKAHARARGVPLSRIVEEALRDATHEAEPPFSARWRGQLAAAHGDDPRRRALGEEYL